MQCLAPTACTLFSVRCNTQSGTAATQTLLGALAPCLQRLGILSLWILCILYAVGIVWSKRVVVVVFYFLSRWAASTAWGELIWISRRQHQKHTLLMGVFMAPQSCHHSLFLLWCGPGRISGVAFEAHAAFTQTALRHRAHTTSSQAVLLHMSPSITPLWRDWNKVACSPSLNLFFISFWHCTVGQAVWFRQCCLLELWLNTSKLLRLPGTPEAFGPTLSCIRARKCVTLNVHTRQTRVLKKQFYKGFA